MTKTERKKQIALLDSEIKRLTVALNSSKKALRLLLQQEEIKKPPPPPPRP